MSRGGVDTVPSFQASGLPLPDQGSDRRQILLFATPPGIVSETMIAVIEREFSWIAVRHVTDPLLACAPFDFTVQLVLMDEHFVEPFKHRWNELKAAHPSASAGICSGGRCIPPDNLIDLMKSGTICGLLPMNVNVDVWLSIISIMLKGGDYCPQAIYMGGYDAARIEQPNRQQPAGEPEGVARGTGATHELTEREAEVLGMVARGLQNKIIAADLGLSEHTVKIHLHNIIGKLGVHNRTEATASYLRRMGRSGGDDRAASVQRTD